jgi:multisubunit Na+/H+ antiporter MnhB subunit
MVELYILLGIMIVGAVIALEVKDMVSSVIAVGAVGLCLCLAFLVLKAPDLAITQLTVEILMLIILIRLTLRMDLPFSTSGRWLINTIITVVFVGVFLAVTYFALKDLPKFGYPIMKVAKTYIFQGMRATGATNLVSSVVLDFRAYDTLGEVTVLFTAVIGVVSVMRKIGRKKENEKIDEEDE